MWPVTVDAEAAILDEDDATDAAAADDDDDDVDEEEDEACILSSGPKKSLRDVAFMGASDNAAKGEYATVAIL